MNESANNFKIETIQSNGQMPKRHETKRQTFNKCAYWKMKAIYRL